MRIDSKIQFTITQLNFFKLGAIWIHIFKVYILIYKAILIILLINKLYTVIFTISWIKTNKSNYTNNEINKRTI